LTTSQRGETVSRDTLVKEAILLLTSSKSQSWCSKSLKEPSHVLKEPMPQRAFSPSQCLKEPMPQRANAGLHHVSPMGWAGGLATPRALSFPVSRSHSLSLALIPCLSLSFPVSRSHSLSLALAYSCSRARASKCLKCGN